MTVAYVSLGSNIDPLANLEAALEALRRRYGSVTASSAYRSVAVGFDGPEFLNMAASFETDDLPERLVAVFRELEDERGRDRSAPRFSSRPLDLDLVMLGDTVMDRAGLRLPRPELLEQAFVLWPMAEIAPGLVHPELGMRMDALWRDFPGERAVISRLDPGDGPTPGRRG